ncbi:STAS/SEC14 domain-containing protein [Neisseria sp. Ec49-e6-T10]|uniref:STAS/SEC14 domain-containing protein n=1 Tax=Neisseria sp. Ec49-e6-T10 TaxID=3140744 RepID=UPI003EB90CE0
MVQIEEQKYGLKVTLSESFTLEDFKQFEQSLINRTHQVHRPDLLLDLSCLEDFTLDMAWEQMRFVRAHEHDFGRVAVVVNDIWMKVGAHISNLLTAQHAKFFDTVPMAQNWLDKDS